MGSTRQPTISDVAREAKVGTTTVSRVINGGLRVAPEVRERIEAVIQKLHYQPNGAARSLARERNHSVGLIVPRLSDRFFADLASIVQQICRTRNYGLLISASCDDEEQTLAELSLLEQQRVEGFLVVPPGRQSSRLQRYCEPLGARMVTIDQPIHRAPISSVQTDNAEAATLITEHLIDHGRKRILFMGAETQLYTQRERRRGYLEAIEAAGLSPIVAEGISTPAGVEQALLRAYRSDASIDGIFTGNNTLAMSAYRCLKKSGIGVPNEIALVTFGDFAMADVLSPSVTCMAQPVEELASTAVDLLFRQFDATKTSVQSVQLPSKLILRESCGCAGV